MNGWGARGARYYDVAFRLPNGKDLVVKVQRNTRRAAERTARAKLANDLGHDPRKCITLSVTPTRSSS